MFPSGHWQQLVTLSNEGTVFLSLTNHAVKALVYDNYFQSVQFYSLNRFTAPVTYAITVSGVIDLGSQN